MGVDRVLVVCLDNLGDLVFASSLFPPLRRHFPDAELAVWCKRYTADLAPLLPDVGRIFASDPFWDRAPGRGKGAMGPFLRAVADIRRARFDVAVLSAAPWRTAAAVAATGIPVRAGLARRRNARFLTHTGPREDVDKPVLVEMARVLEPFGIHEQSPRYRLEPGPLLPQATRLRGALGERVAALHPFASKRDRCVPLPVWFEVARFLRGAGLNVLWLGSGSELDEIRSRDGAGESLFIDRVSAGSVGDTAAALSLATLFVGHDSGPLHVAGALGVPVVGVFAPGQPRRTFPQGIGPSRILARPSPGEVRATDIVESATELLTERGFTSAATGA